MKVNMIETDPRQRYELYVLPHADDNKIPNLETICGAGFWSSTLTVPAQTQPIEGEPDLTSAPNIKTEHGFSLIELPDGSRGIEVKFKKGGEIKIGLICEGARGKLFKELEAYAKSELRRAGVLEHSDFEAIAKELFAAIRGLNVDGDELQTEDQALKLAFSWVREGVRVKKAFSSWAYFYRDDGGKVVGVLVRKRNSAYFDLFYSDQPVLLGPGMPESE